jgi:serine/threonine protein kinase
MQLRKEKGSLPESDILRIFKGICEGTLAFHRHEPAWAHRDIKVILNLECRPAVVLLLAHFSFFLSFLSLRTFC